MSEQLTIETINEQPSAIEHESESEALRTTSKALTVDASKNETHINIKSIPLKKIAELTEQEKKALYDASLNNEFSDYYDVKQFSNGNYRIIKKKQRSEASTTKLQTIAQKAIADNGQMNISTPAHLMQPAMQAGSQKVYMSNDQLLWMHVLDLESKYNKLYSKHKKLKKRYNDLYIEDIDEPAASSATVNDEPPTRSQELAAAQEPSAEQLLYQTYQPTNWRARLLNRNRF